MLWYGDGVGLVCVGVVVLLFVGLFGICEVVWFV